jgi:hypothetical protein
MSPTRLGYKKLGLELVLLRIKAHACPRDLSSQEKRKKMGHEIPSKNFSKNPSHNKGMISWIVWRKSFGGYQQATHLPQTKELPPSRYKSTSIFLYLKVI